MSFALHSYLQHKSAGADKDLGRGGGGWGVGLRVTVKY